MGRLNLWLLVVVAVCAGSFWFGKDLVPDRKGESPSKVPAPPAKVTYALPKEEATIHLSVLNGTMTPGLARRISLLLGKAGCVAESVGNAPHLRFEHSILINRKLPDDRAAALARSLGGVRVIREWDARGSEDAVLVIGGDYARVEAGLQDKQSSRGPGRRQGGMPG